jgi:uncharacterized Tic20 family protein
MDQQPTPTSGGESTSKTTWFLICHLSALSGFLVPFGHILGPLLVWQIKKNEIPEIERHGKDALNFQITMSLAGLIAGFLVIILIGIILVPVVLIAWLIFTILVGIKAGNNEPYKYPFAIQFLK